jgi:hypothetical protein
MTTTDPPPEPTPPRPAGLRTRNQVLAVIAVVLAAAVPIALAFGVEVCPALDAVGIEIESCARIMTPVVETPAPVPGHDAGRPQ